MTGLIELLQAKADAIQPVICLGDEDSVFLTPQQYGAKQAYLDVIETVKKLQESV